MKDCNIVKDLLPLYIEELCSKDSMEFVEKHLEDCAECRESYQYLKCSEVCADSVEKKEINAFQKLEKYISGKILLSYALFLAALVVGTMILRGTVAEAPIEIYYVLMPVVMLTTMATFRSVIHAKVTRRMSTWRIALQGILLAGSSMLMFYTMLWLGQGKNPFGAPHYRLGPVLDALLKMGIVISLGLFVTHLYQVGRKQVRYSLWSNLSLLCIFLNLVYDGILYWMSDFDTVMVKLVENTVILYGIFGVITLGMCAYFYRKEQ